MQDGFGLFAVLCNYNRFLPVRQQVLFIYSAFNKLFLNVSKCHLSIIEVLDRDAERVYKWTYANWFTAHRDSRSLEH